jgi:hypothetical protein
MVKWMNKKLFIAFLFVGLVGTMAGAGLYAKLVDTEKSVGNTFSASSGFDLKPWTGMKRYGKMVFR